MKALFIIVSLILSQQTYASQTATESSFRNNPPMCQKYSTARSWAQGYGSDYENCKRARINAESGALHQCYSSGNDRCSVIQSDIQQISYNRCDYQATASADNYSICEPRKTFVRSAWAQDFGNEYANCSQAQRRADNVATQDCYRAGFRRCTVISQHILRVEGNRFCETSSVVTASF